MQTSNESRESIAHWRLDDLAGIDSEVALRSPNPIHDIGMKSINFALYRQAGENSSIAAFITIHRQQVSL